LSSAVHPVLQSLAIELSQRDGSVLVRAADGRESVRQFASGRRDQDALLPAIDDATHSLDIQPSGFQLLAVDIGPGGFTGLRVSIATIQGIAEVSGADVVGIDGAIVAAASTPHAQDCDGEVQVYLAGKKESAWCTRLRKSGERWFIVEDPCLIHTISHLPAIAIADEHLPSGLAQELVEAEIEVISPVHDVHALMHQACLMHDSGETIPADMLVPIYAREPEAVRIWRNRR